MILMEFISDCRFWSFTLFYVFSFTHKNIVYIILNYEWSFLLVVEQLNELLLYLCNVVFNFGTKKSINLQVFRLKPEKSKYEKFKSNRM